jgi:hypothetical protein
MLDLTNFLVFQTHRQNIQARGIILLSVDGELRTIGDININVPSWIVNATAGIFFEERTF